MGEAVHLVLGEVVKNEVVAEAGEDVHALHCGLVLHAHCNVLVDAPLDLLQVDSVLG